MLDIYKASAGSGKTFTLAYEYIRMMLGDFVADSRSGSMPHTHILAVTFTKKATAEMKRRILQELYLLSRPDEKSDYLPLLLADKTLFLSEDEIRQRAAVLLKAVLQDYSSFNVSTIDGFFQQVVRRFAREMGLPATYDLRLDGEEVIAMAIDSLMKKVRENADTDQVGEWLKQFAVNNIQDNKRWNTKEPIEALSKQLLQEKLQKMLPELRDFYGNKDTINDYRSKLLDIVSDYERLNGVNKGTTKAKNIPDELRIYLTAKHILDNLYPLGVLQDVASEVEQTNRELNRLPIHEINPMLTWLIDNAEAPFIYEKLGQWLHHYMIDEFQDTSTLQWANFKPLIKEAEAQDRQNLIVGDIKQSIYRWRNSNWRLLEGAAAEFANTRQPPMKRNFRSSKTLVGFNNEFFSRYRDFVADKLDKTYPADPQLAAQVRSIYADERLCQQPVKDFEGYISARFFEGSADEVREQCIEAICPVLEDIRQRGGRLCNVAILVRRKEEIRRVAQVLSERGYKVQSAEGLLIDNHPAVKSAIHLLHTVTDSNYAAAGSVEQWEMNSVLPHPLTDEQIEYLASLKGKPLYDILLCVIEKFSLRDSAGADAYLTCLLDAAYHFIQTRTADTAAFLEYWDRYRSKLSVPAAASEDTLQVLTVHSSKGLEYDVVILPFFYWKLSEIKAGTLLWCRPTEPPFDALPLVPVAASSKLENTLFYNEYREEIQNQYIDNLNISYVALTRAKREMYIFAPKPKTTQEGISVQNVGHLIYYLYSDYIQDSAFSVGSRLPLPVAKKEITDTVLDHKYVYQNISSRLHLRRHQTEATDFGTRMHDWLGRITTFADTDSALLDMLREGAVREDQVPEMKQTMQRFQALVAGTNWFDGSKTLVLENDILTPSGLTYRPDRVVIDGHKAQVIDYKFGEEHKREYHEQVRLYMSLLSRMGYEAEGRLVYVLQDRIEKVENR